MTPLGFAIIEKSDEFNGFLATFRHRLVRKALLTLYVLAAVTFGFAHKPITPTSGLDLAAFALPDGSLPVICGGGKGGTSGQHVCAACAACLLTAAPGLIEDHPRLPALASMFVVARWSSDYRAHVGSDWPPNFRSRAPPQLSV